MPQELQPLHMSAVKESFGALITAALHKKICPALKFDKKQDGAHGLALVRDIEGTELKKGMRIEHLLTCLLIPSCTLVFGM